MCEGRPHRLHVPAACLLLLVSHTYALTYAHTHSHTLTRNVHTCSHCVPLKPKWQTHSGSGRPSYWRQKPRPLEQREAPQRDSGWAAVMRAPCNSRCAQGVTIQLNFVQQTTTHQQALQVARQRPMPPLAHLCGWPCAKRGAAGRRAICAFGSRPVRYSRNASHSSKTARQMKGRTGRGLAAAVPLAILSTNLHANRVAASRSLSFAVRAPPSPAVCFQHPMRLP